MRFPSSKLKRRPSSPSAKTLAGSRALSDAGLLPYREFGCLRLAQFISADQPLQHPIVSLENWEFMGGSWHGHAAGFSESLFHQDRPNELGSLALDAETLPSFTFSAALAAVGLPVAAGFSAASIEAVFGRPRKTLVLAADRVTYEYSLGASEP